MSLGCTQHLGAVLLLLRRVQTDPDANHLCSRIPESQIFFEVAFSAQHGRCNGPVNVYPAAHDVAQDSLVGRRLATDIMMLRQAVDRDCYPYSRNDRPFLGNWNYGTGYHHGMDTHLAQPGQQSAQFAMPYQRLASDQGQVQRTMLPDQTQDAIHQFIAAIVSEAPQGHRPSQVILAIRITTGTTERTFPGELDRKHRRTTRKNRRS